MNINNPPISAALLREYYDYNPETGELVWGPRGRRSGETRRMPSYAGTKVGSYHAAMGYINVSLEVDGRTYKVYLHRIAWAIVHGEWSDLILDHIDGNRLNNRIENLRPVTPNQNAWNAGLRTDNTSGMKGVHYNKTRGKWQVFIVVDSKRIHLGYYYSQAEANRVRLLAEVKYHGEYRRASTPELETWLAVRKAMKAPKAEPVEFRNEQFDEVVVATAPGNPFLRNPNVDRIKTNM